MIEIKEETKTYNAKIKFSYLGFDQDTATVWWQLGFDTEFGSFVTDKVNLNKPEQISNILKTLELRSWEELPRKYARVKVKNKKVIGIGNIIRNDWLVIG